MAHSFDAVSLGLRQKHGADYRFNVLMIALVLLAARLTDLLCCIRMLPLTRILKVFLDLGQCCCRCEETVVGP
jgi:hypothetical protein